MLQTLCEVVHFVAKSFQVLVSLLNGIDFFFDRIDFLDISASIGIDSFVIEPVAGLLEQCQDGWDVFLSAEVLVAFVELVLPLVAH